MKSQSNSKLGRKIRELAPWFHNLHLPDGTQTAPDHFLGDFPSYKWKRLSRHLPRNIKGWRVLDIGCNAGYYSFQLAERGANVTAIDMDERYLHQARWAAKQYNLQDKIEFRRMQVYDLAAEDEKYDLVLFMGVFYHLRYPVLALDIVARAVKRTLVFQTLTTGERKVCKVRPNYEIDEREVLNRPGWPHMSFIEYSFANDITNWWIPNHAAVRALLRSAGMTVVKQPGHEIYICKPKRRSLSHRIAEYSPELKNATALGNALGKRAAEYSENGSGSRNNGNRRSGSRRGSPDHNGSIR